MIREKYEEQYLIVLSERTDLRPGDYFTVHGARYQAITYPVGAKREVYPGVEQDCGMINSEVDPLPTGAITARRVKDYEGTLL